MFIIILRFSENKSKASQLMEGHKEWITQGRTDGVFLLVGSLKQQLGGVILASGENPEAIKARVTKDPFVHEKVVTAEILEVSPAKLDPRLSFLMEEAEASR